MKRILKITAEAAEDTQRNCLIFLCVSSAASAVKITGIFKLPARIAILLCLLSSLFSIEQLSRAQSKTGPNIPELRRLFQSPPDDSKIMMRWWWFGPAVTRAEIEREMRLMKEGGIGGFEAQPVYPLALDDATTGIKNLPFLSDDFIDALRFASEKSRELGLRFDLTLGSGWPYGGPQVPIDEAASKLRTERVKLSPGARRAQVPTISAGEKLLGVFLVRLNKEGTAPESAKEITQINDGGIQIPGSLDGPHEIQFFIASRTGMQVKRAAVGAEGFVLDHLNRAAIENYLKKVGERLMQAFGDHPPHAIFCDSLEAYNSDWTGDFLEQFQKRRGYDLKPHLPLLVAGTDAEALAIRHDWGETLTQLLNDRFLSPLNQWSRRHRTLLRIQDYGVPAATLSSNAYADLPEGEGSQWKSLSAARWASSASHIYGRQVTSSETWTWLHSPAFRATPLDMKAEADRHFLQGINQLIGHGWPYTAQGVEYPGWRFYAAGVFNEKNPWWIVMPDVARYLQRISFIMRQGQPANDAAIYLPNDDAWSRLTAGNTNMIEALKDRLGPALIARLLEAGYNFDFFDDASLRQAGHVENGLLAFGDNKYKIVILPSVESIPLDTLQAFEKFARSGGILIATGRKPDKAPGFQAAEADRKKVSDLSLQLFESAGAKGRFAVDNTEQLAGALAQLLAPDVKFSPAAREIGFMHRHVAGAEIYFIANTDNVPHSAKAAFRTTGLRPEWWDPMTGIISPAAVAERSAQTTSIMLALEPYESRVLVFSQSAELSSPAPQASDAARLELDLSADWRVRFGDGEQANAERLRSWTDDERTRYFSGLAAYEKSFVLPGNYLSKGVRVKLDFGEGKPTAAVTVPRASGMRALLDPPVAEAAVVSLNGRRVGSVWCPPYSIDVTDYLKSGENRLQIVVGNTAINFMAGRAAADYRLLNLRYGERFQPQDMDKIQPVVSGLLGPVRLISIKK